MSCSDTVAETLYQELSFNMIFPTKNMSSATIIAERNYQRNPDSIWVIPDTKEATESLMQTTTPVDSHFYLATVDHNVIGLSEVYQVLATNTHS